MPSAQCREPEERSTAQSQLSYRANKQRRRGPAASHAPDPACDRPTLSWDRRVGEWLSRFTPDFDLARPAGVDVGSYIEELQEALAEGWSGFTGTVQEMEGAHPDGVPEPYVMVPYRIRLAYRSRDWLSVTFELGGDEVGSTSHYERRVASDIVDLFESLGLETPQPIPVMAIDHQVAQKLHACTSVGPRGGNDRAHDFG